MIDNTTTPHTSRPVTATQVRRSGSKVVFVTDDSELAAAAKTLPGLHDVLLISIARPAFEHDIVRGLVDAIDLISPDHDAIIWATSFRNRQVCAIATTTEALPAAMLKSNALIERAAKEHRPLIDLAGRLQVWNRDFSLSALAEADA